MTFKYRLERVLNLREQELEKVKSKFQEVNQKIQQIQKEIKFNLEHQVSTKYNLTTKEGLKSPACARASPLK